jgi:hypothetical protein
LVDQTHDSLSDWPDYIAGLISADGSLTILKNGSSFCPGVSITQRADDLPLLREIQRRTRCGQIYLAEARGGAAPAAQWSIRSRADLNSICELMDAHPPRGRRGVEFPIWRRAVDTHLSSASSAIRRRELAELRLELTGLRSYRPPGDRGQM